jgi:hypothetical protein
MKTFWLVIRYCMGWGVSPRELQDRSRMMFMAFAIFILILLLRSLLGTSLLIAFLHVNLQQLLSVSLYSLSHPDPRGWPYVVPFFCALIYGIWMRILIRRVKAQGTAVISGNCFDILLWLPSVIFVQIGPTKDQARWYALPQSWEIAVQPSGVLLEISRGNAYIKRLRREDHDPLTLDHDIIDAKADLPVSEAPKPPKSSKVEIRELRRYARKRGMFWGVSPLSFVGFVIVLIPSVVLYLGIAVWIDIAVLPQAKADLTETINLGIFFGILGLVSLAFSLWMLPRWRWMRRASQQPKETVNGVIVSWANMLLTSGNFEETFLKLRVDDGKERIFRIPHRFIERVTYVLPIDVDHM